MNQVNCGILDSVSLFLIHRDFVTEEEEQWKKKKSEEHGKEA